MIYEKHIPGFPLNIYIDSIIYLQGNNKGTGLPKTAMSIVFNLEDDFKVFQDCSFKKYVNYKKFWVAGLQNQPTRVESYGLSKMILIQFKPYGAFSILNDPLHYYTNQYIPLDQIFSQEAENVWQQLQEADSRKEQFLITENFLYRKILSHRDSHSKLPSIIDLLTKTNSNTSINSICKKIGISRKHLNHLVKEYVGVSPKTFSSLLRLQSNLKLISSSSSESLTSVAYRSEYFDQAHFIKDFKRFTGLSPSAYMQLVNTHQSMKMVPHFIPFA